MANEGTLRAAIYDRVSSDRRQTRRSVTEQNNENRSAATENGWDVVAAFVDNDRSASRFARKTRPDWERLVAGIDAKDFDVVVLWEPSRGSRDLEVWAALLSACRRRGVLIHVTSHGRTYDVRKPRDWRTLAEDGVGSSYESEETSERVARTVRAQAVAGLPHGRVPFGYRREYDSATGVLLRQVPHEETAPYIKEMARRVLSGEALYSIARDLNDRAVPTPTGRPWDLNRIRQILLNPTIAGQRVFRGEVIGPAAWEPIISPDTLAQLSAKLRDPKRRTYVDGSVKHLLVGIARCGVCEAKVKRIKNRGTPSYACSASFCVSRKITLVDEFVEGVVIERLSRPDAVDLLSEDRTGEVAAAHEEAAGLRARLAGFYDSAAEGKLTPMALARIESKLIPQIEAAEKRARSFVSSPVVADLIGSNVAERWESLVIEQRREAIRALLTPVLRRVRGGSGRNDFSSIKIKWNEES